MYPILRGYHRNHWQLIDASDKDYNTQNYNIITIDRGSINIVICTSILLDRVIQVLDNGGFETGDSLWILHDNRISNNKNKLALKSPTNKLQQTLIFLVTPPTAKKSPSLSNSMLDTILLPDVTGRSP